MKDLSRLIYFLLPVIILFAVSCTSRENDTNKEISVFADSSSIRLPHSKSETGMEYINPEDLGIVLTTIEFKVKATQEELEIFEDGIVPWISLEEPEKEIHRLIDTDKAVLPFNKVILIIDYPVKSPVYIPLTSNGDGFSRKQLITAISQQYHAMFKEEEITATNKTTPLEKREGLQNRNETNGKYGIWGHDLSDLDLSYIEVHKNKNGLIYLSLGVES